MSYTLVREVLDYAPQDLSSPERLVLIVLAEHADAQSRQAHPGRDLLAAECGLSEDGVRKITRRLQARGLIEHLGGGHNGRAVTFALAILDRGEVSVSERVNAERANRRAQQQQSASARHSMVRAEAVGQTGVPPTAGSGSEVEPTPVPPSESRRGDHRPRREASRLLKGGLSSPPSVRNRPRTGEGTTTVDALAPPRTCRRHTHGWDHDDPCAACGRDRTNHDRWRTAQTAHARERTAELQRAAREAIAACLACNNEGWNYDDPTLNHRDGACGPSNAKGSAA